MKTDEHGQYIAGPLSVSFEALHTAAQPTEDEINFRSFVAVYNR